MKNLMMIAVVLLSLSTTAQISKKDRGDRMEMKHNMSPEERAQLKSKKMTLDLDLTSKQQVEVEKVMLEHAKMREAKMKEFKALKETSTEEKISKEQRLKMANERLDSQIEMKKKMKAILNADQYSKFENMEHENKQRRGDKARMKRRHK